ncbi:MAG: NAD-dependent epimerase/dehydratase family protein [Candidatus Gastranaerophilales bacterium]|nr:NAD-dependent epimerase/dehydratase family protein [Candidatus Gastranaerophilales bacterium]
MIKNILLTGSGGFIGKNLKKHLENKYNILSPRSFELDCRDKDAVCKYFKENDIDFIIHCGSTGGARDTKDKDTTVADNLAMVINLLETKKDETRMIVFSSGAMYGKQRPIQKIKENEVGDVVPLDLYGESKMRIAQLVEGLKDVICLNIFACYGYDELPTRFPSYAITQNIKHLPIEINRNVVFDYLFIDDLCEIVEHFVNNNWKKYNIINVTPNNSISLLEISELVNKISDFKSDITIKDKTLGNEYTGCNERLLSEIEDMNFTPMEEGLKSLYSYMSFDKKNS